MSRLESAIRRLQAQVACLDLAAALVRDLPGPVLELGLGNGRTYDHLRERLPDREIFVFERLVAAHPDCIPDDEHLFLGNFADTLPGALSRIGRPAALAHGDIGAGDPLTTEERARMVGGPLRALMAEGGILVCDQPLTAAGLRPVALPDGISPGRYYIYRAVQGLGEAG